MLASCRIVELDSATADAYAMVKQGLMMRGRPIPENDIWIAALAVQYGLPLLARDAHFDHVEGLDVKTWEQ